MSYGLYIGKNHTKDGISYLAGYGDEPSSHWLEIIPKGNHESGETVAVGVTPEADLPGCPSTVKQVSETAKHIRVSYSYYKGMPAPLTNGGLNEYGVAVRDIWSASRKELIAMTPADQTGPNYSDLARLVLERAQSAREGVALIGSLIAEYGHSTYGGNSHLIADPDEGWVIIEFAGGQNLWVAERLGENSIRASRPGYIGEIDLTNGHPDYLYSPNLVSFAIERGWFKPDSGETFNVNNVYGDGRHRWEGVQWIESEMLSRSQRPGKISLQDVIWAVRTPKLTGDTAGYGQVVPLVNPTSSHLRMLWHTQTSSIAAPFVPIYMGVSKIPEEFCQHRYLTANESEKFIDRRKPEAISTVPQAIECTRSATYVFKRLLHFITLHPALYMAEIFSIWEGVERELFSRHQNVSEAAEVLINAEKYELALEYLTYFTSTELYRSLDLAENLTRSLEIRTRALYGFHPDPMPLSTGQIW